LFKNIYLDHSYNIDQNFKFYKKLEKLGFTLDEQMVEHPGKAYCKFISLNGFNSRGKFYLEFVSFGKSAPILEKEAGLSFGYKDNLEKFFHKIKTKLPSNFEHKNYNWKENSTDRLPGWNMLAFKKHPIENINTWFTEYEFHPNRKKNKLPKHKNTVESIAGIILVLTKRSKKNLETILGKKIKDQIVLNDGTVIFLEMGKSDRYKSIILNARDIRKVKACTGKSGKTEIFNGNEVVRIDPPNYNTSLSWNLLIQ
jgi:hypothetical protein